jgi:hypothetical protein
VAFARVTARLPIHFVAREVANVDVGISGLACEVADLSDIRKIETPAQWQALRAGHRSEKVDEAALHLLGYEARL